MNGGTNQISLDFLLQITENSKEEVRAFMDDVIQLKVEVLAEMNQAIHNSDYLKIKAGSHKLKSAIKIFGPTLFEEKLETIETIATENDASNLPNLIQEIIAISDEWEQDLEKEFSKL